jgi:undecaprenyl-diphosphatase
MVNKQWSSSFLDYFLPLITDLHKNILFTIFACLVLALFIYNYRKSGLIFLLTLSALLGAGDAFCGNVIKPIFSRMRPNNMGLDLVVRAPEYGGYSFPSNHAFNMFCLATFVSFYFPRFRIVYFAIAFVVAYSRLYVGVHYPSDVLGGAVFGIALGWAGAVIAQRWIQLRLQNKGEINA